MTIIGSKEHWLRTATAVGFAVAVGFGAPVYAQDEAPAEEPAAEEEQPAAEELVEEAEAEAAREDTIVVTGSRLRRDTFTSVSPIQVVEGERARDLGLIDAQAILTQTTVTQGQQNTVGVSTLFGLQQPFTTIGSATPSLRGLGSSVSGRVRNLILINGRRLGPIGVGGAPANPDVSMIPGSLIERTEILLDGASSIYGSDAVAGVVNYILRKDINGLELDLYHTESEHGWGDNNVLSLTAGMSNEKGFATFAVEYNAHEQITLSDIYFDIHGKYNQDVGCLRSFGEFTGPPQGDAGDYNVGYFDGKEIAICNDTPAGFLITGVGNIVANTPNGTTLFPPAFKPGFFVDGLATRNDGGNFFRPINDPDINGFPENHGDTYFPEVNRLSTYATGEYEIFSDTRMFWEALYSNRTLSSKTTNQEVLPVSADNPFNPFPTGGLFVYAQPNGVEQEIDVYRTVVGAKGDLTDFEIGSVDNISWEAFTTYHRSTGFQARTGFLLEDRLAQGMASFIDPVTNEIVCETANPDNFFGFDTVRAPIACVPLNPFVPEFLLQGRFETDEMNDFAYGASTVTTTVEQLVSGGYLQGDVFDSPWGGTIRALFGVEYRYDKINTTPSEVTRQGLLQGVDADRGATGSRDLFEFFGEVSVPLVTDKFLIKNLNLEGAFRFTDEEFAGSAWTWQGKGEYSPVEWVTLRGGIGTSFRAADTGELFGTGTVFVIPSRVDPCYVSSLHINPVTNTYDPALETRSQTVLDNCVAVGLDPTTHGTVGQGTPTLAFTTTPVAFGNFGNLATDPETSVAWFGGLVVDQPWIKALTVRASITYFNYIVKGSIGQLTRSRILNDCMESVGLSDPLCAFAERDDGGVLVSVNEASINLGATTARGFDLNVLIEHDLKTGILDAPINISMDTALTRMLGNTEDVLGNNVVTDLLGDLTLGGGFPELQIVNTLVLRYKDFGLLHRFRYISDVVGTPERTNTFDACFNFATGTFDPNCIDKEYTKAYFQHDITAFYNFETWTVRAGVTNVTDHVQAIDLGRGLANVPIEAGHDIYGRRYFLNVTKRF